MKSILIKNGTVATSKGVTFSDILVSDGKIKKIDQDIEPGDSETEIIDASNYIVFPGGIDPHVHMELPVGNGIVSTDDFESGSRAAIAGGTTTFIDFVTPTRGQSLVEALHERKELAANSLCHWKLHASVTEWYDGLPDDLKYCREKEGINSVKVYMAYKNTIGLNDTEILKVMKIAAELDMMVLVHCEDGDMIETFREKLLSEGKKIPYFHPFSRPPEAEVDAVRRAVDMAKKAGCRLYIVHISTKEALEIVNEAKSQGLPVYAEVCIHHLLLDDRKYRESELEGAMYVMSPPLRKRSDCEALWNGLRYGAVDTVATDHCPFNLKGQKDKGIDDFTLVPNGVPGIQHRMGLLYQFGVREGRIPLEKFVEVTSTRAAELFGFSAKGTIAEGSDADLVLWNPQVSDTIHASTHFHNCDYSIYEKFKISGKPVWIFCSNGVFSSPTKKIRKKKK